MSKKLISFIILGFLLFSNFPIHIAQAAAPQAAVTYTLPISPNAGPIRVSRTGYLYKDSYIAAGLNKYQNDDYHPYLSLKTGNLPKEKRGAIDFGGGGWDVVAAADGEVTESNNCEVWVKSGDDTVLYLHHSHKILIGKGPVKRGQKLAVTGGYADCGAQGDHLHFAVWRNGVEVAVNFQDAPRQTSNGYTCPAGLVCPSRGGFVEFRYSGSLPGPAAPSNLTLTYLPPNNVQLDWDDKSNDETGFKIYRDGVFYTSVQANQDYIWVDAESHCYSVSAFHANGESEKTQPTCYHPPAQCPSTYTTSQWKSEFYNNISLTGNRSLCRNDASVDFNWGAGSPSGNVPADNFSARFSHEFIKFDAGKYRFFLAGDDGVRLFIDGVKRIDQWKDQAFTEYSVEVDMSAGNHPIMVEYYERGGGAAVKLRWEKVVVSQPQPTPPPPAGIWETGQRISLKPAASPWLALDIYGGKAIKDAKIVQWEAHGGRNQIWKVESFSNGYYRLHSDLDYNQCMVVQYASKNNGAKIILHTCSPNGQDNEWWKPAKVGNFLSITSKLSGKVLDVPGGSTKWGEQIILWPWNGSKNQQWISERK